MGNGSGDLKELIGRCSREERVSILGAVITVICKDGRITDEERGIARSARDLLGIDQGEADRMMMRAGEEGLKVVIPSSEDARQVMFIFAVHAAAADGRLPEGEWRIVRRLGERVGLSADAVDWELVKYLPISAGTDFSQFEPSFLEKLRSFHEARLASLQEQLKAVGGTVCPHCGRGNVWKTFQEGVAEKFGMGIAANLFWGSGGHLQIKNFMCRDCGYGWN